VSGFPRNSFGYVDAKNLSHSWNIFHNKRLRSGRCDYLEKFAIQRIPKRILNSSMQNPIGISKEAILFRSTDAREALARRATYDNLRKLSEFPKELHGRDPGQISLLRPSHHHRVICGKHAPEGPGSHRVQFDGPYATGTSRLESERHPASSREEV
jgi:hypothetical protein